MMVSRGEKGTLFHSLPPCGWGAGRGVAASAPPEWTPTPDLESELRSPRTPQGGGERESVR
jgi:hypothetical protein